MRLIRPLTALQRQFSHRSRATVDRFNYNSSSPLSFVDNASELGRLRRVTAADLVTHTEPPKGVSMLVRDFIHDALYNPHYGYFSKRAMIFSNAEPFDFQTMRDSSEFTNTVAAQYAKEDTPASEPGPGNQVWHTPVELFQPWYGQAIAQCLVSEYLIKHFPYEDFVVYEMGGGNGTLASNILGYLQTEYPEVYERTHYKIIEISPNLATIQMEKLRPHSACAQVINKSIFDWEESVSSPCFFVALEVVDNFAHDLTRYSAETLAPLQGLTAVTSNGDYEEIFEPLTDPLISQYLNTRDRAGHISPAISPSNFSISSSFLRKARSFLPLAPNLTKSEFVPTQLLAFLHILSAKFPLHRLLLSDFSSLPDTIGTHVYNAPVVQTRYQNTMVPCSTYMVQPGYFDIFFPTNFELLRDMHSLVVGGHSPMAQHGIHFDFFSSKGMRPSPLDNLATSGRRPSVYSHRQFLEKYGDSRATTLRSGENPMLDYYQNVKFLF